MAAVSEDMQSVLNHALSSMYIGDILADVTAPVLVIDRQDNQWSEGMAQQVAASISGARLLVVPGQSALPMIDESSTVVEAMLAFLSEDESARGDRAESKVANASVRTILFTDLESSTALTQAVGDAKAQDVLHGHNDVVRAALAAHEGEEVKHTGDGIMASFTSAVSAVEAAQQIQRDLAGGEVRVRIGLNAGEPIHEEGDYFGGSVQLAARVCDRAEPGQVLVSNVVRELCTGKMFQFADQGEATLKGFPEPVRLFAVEPPVVAD
jgi:class 3 adenylate cyclase